MHWRHLRLGGGDGHCSLAHVAAVERRVAGQIHERRGADRADEVAGVDHGPRAQQPRDRQLAAGDGHHHQRIAGKQFGTADHDEDQSQREAESCQQPRNAEWQSAGAGGRNRRQHCAEGDECAGQHREHEQARAVALRLGDAELLGLARHRVGQQRVEAAFGFVGGVGIRHGCKHSASAVSPGDFSLAAWPHPVREPAR